MTHMHIKAFTYTTVCLLILILAGEDSATAGVKKHRKTQSPPIKLGTSGGNANDFIDLAAGACRSGTLGGLVQNTAKDVRFILSTNEILGRNNDAKKGDPIIQPGLTDTKGGSCNPANPGGHTVADLTKFKKVKFGGIKNNKVNAALAEVRAGMVQPEGRVIGIGIPGSHFVAPFLGQVLKKSGRGSGVKRGTVVAVNLTSIVGYPIKGEARYVKQFLVESNTNKALLKPGDGGAIFFENTVTCPGMAGLTVGLSLPGGQFGLVTKMATVLNKLQKVKPKGKLEAVGCASAGVTITTYQSSQVQSAMLDAERIQRAVQRDVMRLPGVVGMGIGTAKDNPEEVVFKILVEDDAEAIRANIPEWLGEVRAELLEIGRFSSM